MKWVISDVPWYRQGGIDDAFAYRTPFIVESRGKNKEQKCVCTTNGRDTVIIYSSTGTRCMRLYSSRRSYFVAVSFKELLFCLFM